MKWELFSPTDYRYQVEELKPYLSEKAYVEYKAKVEIALLRVLERKNICPPGSAEELRKSIEALNLDEVYREEQRIKHDVKALVNVLRRRMRRGTEFVHLTATSYDVVDTANVLRYRDGTEKVILPLMIALQKRLIKLARSEQSTLQIGRTHGQHAVPLTFGFVIANYVDRWGERLSAVKKSCLALKGKFSGAVGAYNASSLLVDDPEKFEQEIMKVLGIKAERISTQIVPGDAKSDFIHSIISSFSVLANLSDDLRNLQRSEIGEVYETVEKDQVGSTTMPHKRNPISFENVKSLYKAFLPRVVTVYLDQISEHQRDLTNSASQRFIPELLNGFAYATRRMERALSRLKVDRERMKKKINDFVLAEPLYILLSYHGCEQAHERVRRLALRAYEENKSIMELAKGDEVVKKYLAKFTDKERKTLSNPKEYTGIASEKTDKICKYWEERLRREDLW